MKLQISGLSDVLGGTVGKSLRNYCQTLVEEYEEEIKENIFRKDFKFSRWLCHEEAAVCKADQYDAAGDYISPAPPSPPAEDKKATEDGAKDTPDKKEL